MIEQDSARGASRSMSTRRTWRDFGRRHGVEHPQQARDRARRHQTEVDGRMDRIEARAASGPQNRFDARTTGQVATKAAESRRLNARYVDRLPPKPQHYAFEAEQTAGSFFRNSRESGQQARHADYAWRMDDGFRF
jgi:hypothetical protein